MINRKTIRGIIARAPLINSCHGVSLFGIKRLFIITKIFMKKDDNEKKKKTTKSLLLFYNIIWKKKHKINKKGYAP